MVEGASQGDRGQMRSIEDTALIRGGFDFDIGPVLFKARIFPNLYRRRNAWKWDARPNLHLGGVGAGRRGHRRHPGREVLVAHDRRHVVVSSKEHMVISVVQFVQYN